MIERLVWLVPAAVLIMGVWRPKAAILLLVATLPLFGSPPGGPYLAALDVAALAVLFTTAIHVLGSAYLGAWRKPSGDVPGQDKTPLDWPALAVLGVSAASLFPLAYHLPGWRPEILSGLLRTFSYVQRWSIQYTWRALASLVVGWALFAAVRRNFRPRTLWQIGAALACGLAPLLVLGLLEYVDLISLAAYRTIGGELYAARLHSLFFHSGWLAEYLVLATPLAVASLWSRGRNARRAALGLIALTLPTLLFTHQRGAWVAALVELLVLAGLRVMRRARRRHATVIDRRVLLVTAGTGALALLVIVGGVVLADADETHALVERMGRATADLSGRSDVWVAAVEMTRDRPLLGWGLGSFAPVFDVGGYATPSQTGRWLTAHNFALDVTSESGLLGLVAFGLLAWAVAASLRHALRSEQEGRRHLATGLVVGWAGFLTYGAVQDPFYLPVIQWLTWILLAATALLATGERRRAVDRVAWAVIGLAVLLVPWRVVAVPSAPPRGDHSYGLHAWEVQWGRGNPPHRWTESHAALRVEKSPGDLLLELANGHPRAARHSVEVEISIDGRSVRRLRLDTPEWTHVVVPEEELPTQEFTLALTAHPAFRPFRIHGDDSSTAPSTDLRRLGVAMRPLHWRQRN